MENNTTSFLDRTESLKKLFASSITDEAKYTKIIELGSTLISMKPHDLTEENLVTGCQSLLYLKAYSQNDQLLFEAHSDALISKGLTALLIHVYSGLTPYVIVKNPPTFLSELNLLKSLSPSRSNGVAAVYLKMQQLAIKNLSSFTSFL
jgi:cysteine desulfuration protein SufE